MGCGSECTACHYRQSFDYLGRHNIFLVPFVGQDFPNHWERVQAETDVLGSESIRPAQTELAPVCCSGKTVSMNGDDIRLTGKRHHQRHNAIDQMLFMWRLPRRKPDELL